MKRKQMIDTQLVTRNIKDPRVLEAMSSIERHLFVSEEMQHLAYEDHPVQIGHSQTISQPYIVAFMSEAGMVKPTDNVLEIGTGCGYQSAVLAKLAKHVYSIEIIEELGKNAKTRLKKLGFMNVTTKIGDGYEGWPEHAPFDVIIVTAAPKKIPTPLLEQLKTGGRLIIPVGEHSQELLRITKTKTGTEREKLLAVRFVPMTGKAQK